MKNWPFLVALLLTIVFFWQFFFKGLLPIPADTIVGLYHPFRDLYVKEYPRGIPFKNALITDPIRQQYPWKKLVIEQEKKGQIPIWNPYEMGGKPLLANFQSGAFYPFNLIFFLLPFNLAWALYIAAQPLLAMLFTYLFLNNLKLSKTPSLFGGFIFAFSGFSIAWLEWGNILHTALWLPLILLSADKINSAKNSLKWSLILILSLVSSFFAGHLQFFFYLFVVSIAYIIFRWVDNGKDLNKIKPFVYSAAVVIAATSIQWIPTLKFISQSARSLDATPLSEGWFIPWQHVVQFIAPDFFGNPSTLNYWGTWNYGEFVGYVGIFPLLLVFFILFFKRSKNILFFGTVFFLSLLLALPNFVSKLPYALDIPFISTSQPTRLIFLADFALAVLAAFGLDYFLKIKKVEKGIFYSLGFIAIVLILLWISVFNSNSPNLAVARQNLILPSILFASSLFILLFQSIKEKYFSFFLYALILLTVFDLFRFGWKFTPFTKQEYLFPQTKILSFLQSQQGEFRVMTDDSRILPPNVSSVYKIESVDGYDPLYPARYGEFIAASERGEPNIKPPFGFNRIITPHRFDSNLMDLIGVRYVLSLYDIQSDELAKIMEEEQTKLYENKNHLPRVFFVGETSFAKDKETAIAKVMNGDLKKVAVVEGLRDSKWSDKGNVEILEINENSIELKTENEGDGFLVLVETFYPSWKAKIDGIETQIYRTNFNFRGIVVPQGNHIIEFSNSLL
jgi:hypothetical protein